MPVDIGAELPEAELKPGVLLIQQDAGDLEASGGLFRLQLFQETVRQNTFTVRDEHHVGIFKALLLHEAQGLPQRRLVVGVSV